MAGLPDIKQGTLLVSTSKANGLTATLATLEYGWATWIRTRECWHQKPVPYRLAIAQQIMVRSERLELSHLAAPEPKSGASTNSATTANS